MDNELTAEEQKHFDTKGETPIPEEKPEEKSGEKPEENLQEKVGAKPEAKPEEKQRWVDIRALHEERNKRKLLERKVQDQDKNHSVLQSRLDTLMRLAKGPETQVPGFEENPAEHLRHKQQSVEQELASLKRKEAERDEQSARSRALDEFKTEYRRQAQEFASETKDFPDAYRHLLKSRAEELHAAGIPNVGMVLEQEEAWLAEQAMRQGKNPADAIYRMAKARGYKPGNGQARDAAGQFTKAEEKVDALAKGIEASKSLGAVGGTGGTPAISLEALAKMPADEFEEWTVKNPKKWKQMMGG